MCRSGTLAGIPGRRHHGGRVATTDGRVVVRAETCEGVVHARFMLALEDDTSGFHERFDRDPLLGATARSFTGYRPLRLATVATQPCGRCAGS